METKIKLTNKQARMALEFLDQCKRYAKNYNQRELKEMCNWNNSISIIDGKTYYTKFNDGLNYTFLIENKTCPNIIQISNGNVCEKYTLTELEQQLNDLTDLEQRKALEDMYLDSIEKYLSKMCGTQIKLKSMITNPDGRYQLKLYTDNLVDKCGICKAMFKNIYIESDPIYYYVNQNTWEQELGIMRFSFKYEHTDGAYNGKEFAKILFNETNAEFEGYNYETRKYEVI